MEPRGDGPDEHVRDIVSQVTVRALREFTTGDMEDADGGGNRETAAPFGSSNAANNPEGSQSNGRDRTSEMPVADTQDLLPYNPDDVVDIDNEEGEEGSSGSDAELESNEVVVLDPDHPLMRRFQQRLKEILQRRSEKLELELREIREAVNAKKKEREDVGVELYGVQQELARYQLTLESLQVCTFSFTVFKTR
jgi:Rad3-related DNA helicase